MRLDSDGTVLLGRKACLTLSASTPALHTGQLCCPQASPSHLRIGYQREKAVAGLLLSAAL